DSIIVHFKKISPEPVGIRSLPQGIAVPAFEVWAMDDLTRVMHHNPVDGRPAYGIIAPDGSTYLVTRRYYFDHTGNATSTIGLLLYRESKRLSEEELQGFRPVGRKVDSNKELSASLNDGDYGQIENYLKQIAKGEFRLPRA